MPDFFHQFEGITNPELELLGDTESITDGVGTGIVLEVTNSEVYTGNTGKKIFVTVQETLSAGMFLSLKSELFKHAKKGDLVVAILRGNPSEVNVSHLAKPFSELSERFEKFYLLNDTTNPAATANFIEKASVTAEKVKGSTVKFIYGNNPQDIFGSIQETYNSGKSAETPQAKDEPEL